jgi:hypothetical protein
LLASTYLPEILHRLERTYSHWILLIRPLPTPPGYQSMEQVGTVSCNMIDEGFATNKP